MVERSPWRRDLLVHVDQGRLYHKNRIGHTRRRLTVIEAEALLKFAWDKPSRQRLALMLMMVAGLRKSEVRAIEHSDFYVEGETRYLSVRGKGRKTRAVPLEPLIVGALDQYLNAKDGPGRPVTTGPLIRHPEGGPVHLNTLGYWVRRVGTVIGRPDLTPHELRRTYATLLRDRGAPIETTQLMLGHSNSELTRDFYDVGDRRWTQGTGLTTPSVA